jgi:predicted MPP superfamily phosphohydrolase
LRGLFWKYFFRLLLLAIAAAEWLCTAWLLRGLAGWRAPGWLHVLAPLAIHVLNTALLRSVPPKEGGALKARRIYTGFAFSSVYGLLFLVFLLVASDLVWAVLAVAGFAPGRAEFDAGVLAAGTAGLLVIGAAMAHGYTRGQRRVWVNEVEVPLPNLPHGLDGFRIAQLSDIHLGPFMSDHDIARHVDRVNGLGVDLVALTGDITDGLDHAPRTFKALAGLRAREGVVAILGNHDVGTGTEAVKAALARYTHFVVLDDEVHVIERGGERLWVIGLMDRGLDWARGLQRCPVLERLFTSLPSASPVVVLSHRPDLFPHAAELGCPLVLSGHTHGGQVGVPWSPGRVATLARFMTRWPRGTYRLGRSVLHVNLGLGMTGQPVRVATPREITVVTLRSLALPFAEPGTTRIPL